MVCGSETAMVTGFVCVVLPDNSPTQECLPALSSPHHSRQPWFSFQCQLHNACLYSTIEGLGRYTLVVRPTITRPWVCSPALQHLQGDIKIPQIYFNYQHLKILATQMVGINAYIHNKLVLNLESGQVKERKLIKVNAVFIM